MATTVQNLAWNVRLIVSDNPASRDVLHVLGREGESAADAAIRQMRRQVQRRGDVARDAMLSWCGGDDERALLLRALDPRVRVGTVVREWAARG